MKNITFRMDKNYARFLQNKSVALVGPSPSIKGSGKGAFIDSHDVVIRLNKAVPVPSNMKLDIGTKTNILYNCLKPGYRNGGKIDIDLWIKNRVSYISSPYPELSFTRSDIQSFCIENKNRIKFHKFPLALYNKISLEIGTRPNTGFLAIIDILLYGIKSLYVTGITFGIDGYYKEYSNISLSEYRKMANKQNHRQNPQFLYIKNKVFNVDRRFRPDKTLSGILERRRRV